METKDNLNFLNQLAALREKLAEDNAGNIALLGFAADLELVREPLVRRIGPGPALYFVEADICRRDLLLEIEGVAGLAPG